MLSDRTKHRKENIHRVNGGRIQAAPQQPQTITYQQKVRKQHYPVHLRLETKRNQKSNANIKLVNRETCQNLFKRLKEMSTLP